MYENEHYFKKKKIFRYGDLTKKEKEKSTIKK